MVICVLKDLVLDDNVVLEHTTFEISKHQSFKELELTSANNKKSRTMCIFNHVLDPNIKWYARARCLLSTGMTVWGNVDTFESIVDTDYIDSIDMPSRVGVPQITTNSLQDKHDLTLFTMQAEGFKVVGNGALYATTWIIEDIDGNVIWSVLKSTLYRTKIDVRDLILKPNSIYRLKAIFHSSSNDTSPVGCLTITTLNNDKLTVTKYLDVVDSTKDLELEINGIDGVKAVHWELIDYAGSIATTKWKATTDVTNENMWKTVVPRLTMKEGSVYLLKISTDVMDVGRKFIPFNTAVRTKTAEQEQQELLDKLVENTREAIISGTYLYGYKKNEINLGWLDKYGNKGRNDDDVGGASWLDLNTVTLQELLDYAPVEFWLDRFYIWLAHEYQGSLSYQAINTSDGQRGLRVECTKCFVQNAIADYKNHIRFAVRLAKYQISNARVIRSNATKREQMTHPDFRTNCASLFKDVLTKYPGDGGDMTMISEKYVGNPIYTHASYFCPHVPPINYYHRQTDNRLNRHDFCISSNLNWTPPPNTSKIYQCAPTKQELTPTARDISQAWERLKNR